MPSRATSPYALNNETKIDVYPARLAAHVGNGVARYCLTASIQTIRRPPQTLPCAPIVERRYIYDQMGDVTTAETVMVALVAASGVRLASTAFVVNI